MDKIEVKVCLGTTCFVTSRAILNELNTVIPQKYGDKVVVTSSPCFGLCSIKWSKSKSPYVKVNDEIIEEATTEKVIEFIEKLLA